MSQPKWDYREGYIRNKGTDKFGNLVFHVPWTIGNNAAANPNYDIVPPHGVWKFGEDYNPVSVTGTWMWDRFVISSFPLTPDGRWQFYELILSKDHVQGQWEQHLWESDKPKIKVALQSYEDAKIRYVDRKFTEQFGWMIRQNTPPGVMLQWYDEGMGPTLPKSKCRIPTPDEIKNAMNDSVAKTMGYTMYCQPWRDQFLLEYSKEFYGETLGGILHETGNKISESTVGQFVADTVGTVTGGVKLTDEDKDLFLPNRDITKLLPKIPDPEDFTAPLLLVAGIALMAIVLK